MNTAEIAEIIEYLVSEASHRFKSFSPADWQYRRAADKWSRIEVLGHLIDSAANNHHRFVRSQFAPAIELVIGYQQNEWVAAQHYHDADPLLIVGLWANYNRHLAHIIRHLDPATFDRLLATPGGDVHTLAWWVEDYPKHMKHHLGQI